VIEAFSLAWPVGRPRSAQRQRARFYRGVDSGSAVSWKRKVESPTYQGVSLVRAELERPGAGDLVISRKVQSAVRALVTAL
jgi:hypothetical protein